MWVFYVLSFIPLIIGFIFWVFNKEVLFFEWVAGTVLGFVLSIIFHISAINGMGGDIETWSGRIEYATYYPKWVEQYQQMHTRTVGSGKDQTTEIYYTTEYRTHHEQWVAYTSIPDSHEINESFFKEIKTNFKNTTVETPYKSGFYSGDKNIYVSYNKTNFIYPVTALKQWTNKVAACPSLFSYPPVPESAKVFEYPKNKDWRRSDRLVGKASSVFNIYTLDAMNARIGPSKKVNVIIVGFPTGTPPIYAQYQEAKWIGGKKNDFVICFAGNKDEKPEWVYVFGWTEKHLAKQNVQTILLYNYLNDGVLPAIESEIVKNYIIKDWTKFDYLTIEPPTWSYWVFGIVLLVFQSAYWFWAHTN